MRAARWVVVLAGVLGAECAQAATLKREVALGAATRSYDLVVPDGLAAQPPAPLVLAFHGGGGRGAGMDKLSHFSQVAEREKFLVAFPDGLHRHWNDGRELGADDVDDVAFVRAILDDVAKLHPVDERRVYATGMSNGAVFCHYLALKLSDRIAAIAPVAGGIAKELDTAFAPKHPVAVLILQGRDDPLMPYGGGTVARTRGEIVPTERALALWREADGLKGAAKQTDLPDTDPRDGCRVTQRRWTGGKAGTEVQILDFAGGGHTWSGGKPYLPPAFIGKTCRDVDATEVIWAFFKAHPKR